MSTDELKPGIGLEVSKHGLQLLGENGSKEIARTSAHLYEEAVHAHE